MQDKAVPALWREWLDALDRNEVRVEQSVVLVRHLPVLVVGNGAGAVIATVALSSYVDASLLWPLIASIALLIAPMVSSWMRLRNRPAPARVSRRHIIVVIAHSTALGLVWATLMFFYFSQTPFQVFAALLSGATFLSLASVAALSVIPLACIGYSAPIMFAAIVLSASSANPMHGTLTSVLLLMCMALIGFLAANWRTAKKVIDLSGEKSLLLKNLAAELDTTRIGLEARKQSDAALRDSEAVLAQKSALLQTTLDRMDQGIMMINAERIVEVCNQRALDLLDLPAELMASRPKFTDVLKYQWETSEFVHTPEDLRKFIQSGGLLDKLQTYERKRPNGRYIEVRSVPLAGGGVVRTYTDTTDRKTAEHSLVESEKRFRAVFSALSEGVTLQNRESRLLACNESATRILGITAEELAERYLRLDICSAIRENGEPFPGREHPSSQALRSGEAVHGVVMGLKKRDDSRIWISINAEPLFADDAAEPYAVVCSFEDITERKAFEERLLTQSMTDALTRVANRRRFLEVAEIEINKARGSGSPLSFLMLDIDHFKRVNDTLGHDAGDEVLRAISAELGARIRTSDCLARMGGEEFAVLLPGTPLDDAVKVAETLCDSIRGLTIDSSGSELVRVTISAGVATFAADDSGFAEAMRRADHALYKAKSEGRDCVRAQVIER